MSSVLPSYPIEIELPDILPYAEGSHGIAYVFSFDSGEPGRHVMINALTHGNEVCGAIVVGELLESGLRPRRGRLTLSFANVEAYQRFDPDSPDKSRFVDQDLNRVWSESLLDDPTQSSIELNRARELRPIVDTVDLLLDVHSMHEKSSPLSLAGPLDKGVALARAVGSPSTIVRDAGHTDGKRLRDYGAFGDDQSGKGALLIECGQHWERRAPLVARDCVGRFLRHAGIVESDDLPRGWISKSETMPEVIQVTGAVVASSEDFHFAEEYTGLEVIPEAGSVIAWDGGDPIVTPYDGCVLIMPSVRQLRVGVTVVRFGRREATASEDLTGVGR